LGKRIRNREGQGVSFVLDTNIISEARRGSRADTNVMGWLASVAQEDLYLSVLVNGEISQGIEGLRRRDPFQAGRLESWLAGLRRPNSAGGCGGCRRVGENERA
jgi:hypothetical protein